MRNICRTRKISNQLIADVLRITQNAVQSKIYRPTHHFSLAQILIMRESLFPDVSLIWLITGKYDESEPPEYVARAEFYEIELLIRKLNTEANRVEKHV